MKPNKYLIMSNSSVEGVIFNLQTLKIFSRKAATLLRGDFTACSISRFGELQASSRRGPKLERKYCFES